VLRVAPPYVVDARGERHEAKLGVSGCAYDASPAGPWGRTVTSPGAERCAVRVTWARDIAYPAMVDPAWTATGSMATARELHTASTLPSGRVLVAGGVGGPTGAFQSAELFDGAGNAGAGTFAATGSMAMARSDHTASVLPSGKVLVTGGSDQSAELFDSTAGTFTATGSMTAMRTAHTASVLPSGMVLVAGGYNNFTVASTEMFDPAGNAGAGAFVASRSMAHARDSHTASVLLSGKVLVAGGIGFGSAAVSTELFDPVGNGGVGTFIASGSMANARTGHTASVLPSGKVLVAGGGNGAGVDVHTASAELFSFVAAGGACAAGGECVSGFCADGLCCDAACTGDCDRCDLPGTQGTCTVVPVGFVGASPPCALPYSCDGANAVCPTSCASNAACATGFVCNAAQCRPAASCDGDHTTTAADGTKHDCAPYRCDSNGACRTTCLSVGCVAPATCDGSGKCVLPPADSAPPPENVAPTDTGSSNGGGGGCSVVSAKSGNARRHVAWLTAVAGLALVRRKRRSSGREE
jgi:hypothetical protein